MNLWQWHYRNRMKKKNFVAIGLWQWHCRNRWEITKSTHILILSVFFFTKIIWFVTFFYDKSNLRNRPYFKYIDYARCKPKKKVHRLLLNKKNKMSINQSPQLLISSDSYSLHGIYSHIHHIMPKRFFLYFYSLVFFYPKQFALCFHQPSSPLHSTLIPLISLPTIFNTCVSYILQTTIRNNTYKYLSVLLSLRRWVKSLK